LVLTLSLVLFLGALVLFLCRFAGLPVWQAVVCTLFGFYLASSPLAPLISEAVRTLVGLLS
jgi:hypothetical protein